MPHALFLGVDYELFWKLNPKKLRAFEKAFEDRQELVNQELWLQGIYFQAAVASVLSSKDKYFEKPINFKEAHAKAMGKNMAARFSAAATIFNNSLSKKKDEGVGD